MWPRRSQKPTPAPAQAGLKSPKKSPTAASLSTSAGSRGSCDEFRTPDRRSKPIPVPNSVSWLVYVSSAPVARAKASGNDVSKFEMRVSPSVLRPAGNTASPGLSKMFSTGLSSVTVVTVSSSQAASPSATGTSAAANRALSPRCLWNGMSPPVGRLVSARDVAEADRHTDVVHRARGFRQIVLGTREPNRAIRLAVAVRGPNRVQLIPVEVHVDQVAHVELDRGRVAQREAHSAAGLEQHAARPLGHVVRRRLQVDRV